MKNSPQSTLSLDTCHRLFFIFQRSHVDSKLGAHRLAQTAAQAFALVDYLDQIIALGTELIGHFQDAARAKLGTISAAFAPFYINMHPDRSGGLIVYIKRLSPQLHICTALTLVRDSLYPAKRNNSQQSWLYPHLKKKYSKFVST
jgi:hypothetical protein